MQFLDLAVYWARRMPRKQEKIWSLHVSTLNKVHARPNLRFISFRCSPLLTLFILPDPRRQIRSFGPLREFLEILQVSALGRHGAHFWRQFSHSLQAISLKKCHPIHYFFRDSVADMLWLDLAFQDPLGTTDSLASLYFPPQPLSDMLQSIVNSKYGPEESTWWACSYL